jgi:hypothetical protein
MMIGVAFVQGVAKVGESSPGGVFAEKRRGVM